MGYKAVQTSKGTWVAGGPTTVTSETQTRGGGSSGPTKIRVLYITTPGQGTRRIEVPEAQFTAKRAAGYQISKAQAEFVAKQVTQKKAEAKQIASDIKERAEARKKATQPKTFSPEEQFITSHSLAPSQKIKVIKKGDKIIGVQDPFALQSYRVSPGTTGIEVLEQEKRSTAKSLIPKIKQSQKTVKIKEPSFDDFILGVSVKRPKEAGETIDIRPSLDRGYFTPFPKGELLLAPEKESKIQSLRKKLEEKEIKLGRAGKKSSANIFGSASTILYPIRTKEATIDLLKTAGEGLLFGAGVTVLSLVGGPVAPAIVLYGGGLLAATQIPKLQESILEAELLGPRAKQELLFKDTSHLAAGLGGGYLGSVAVSQAPVAIKASRQFIFDKFKAAKFETFQWDPEFITSKKVPKFEQDLIKSGLLTEKAKSAVLGQYDGIRQFGIPTEKGVQLQLFPKSFKAPSAARQQPLELTRGVKKGEGISEYLGVFTELPPQLKTITSFKIKPQSTQYELISPVTGTSFFSKTYAGSLQVPRSPKYPQKIDMFLDEIGKPRWNKKGSLTIGESRFKPFDSEVGYEKIWGSGKDTLLELKSTPKESKLINEILPQSKFNIAVPNLLVYSEPLNKKIAVGDLKTKTKVFTDIFEESSTDLKAVNTLELTTVGILKTKQKTRQELILEPIAILEGVTKQRTKQSAQQITKQITIQEPIQEYKPIIIPIAETTKRPIERPIDIVPPPGFIKIPNFDLPKRGIGKELDFDLGLNSIRRRGRGDIIPKSDLFSINITEIFTGKKATQPKATPAEKDLFDLGFRGGKQFFPTIEQREGKVPSIGSIFGPTKRKHSKSYKKGEWIIDLL